MIKQSVLAGLGIAFISLHTVETELRRGDLVLLAGPRLPVVRQWFLVDPSRGTLSPAARRISDAILGLKGSSCRPCPRRCRRPGGERLRQFPGGARPGSA